MSTPTSMSTSMPAAVPPRAEVPAELTWDLSVIFSSDHAWEEAFGAIEARLPAFQQLQGTLGRSARDLHEGLTLRDRVAEPLDRLFEYAHRKHHEDMADTRYAAMSDRAFTLYSAFAAAVSFYTPEILAIAPDRLEAFFTDQHGLATYRHEIDTITIQRPHIRSAEVEKLLADVSEVAQGPRRIYQAVHNLDRQLPVITDEEGRAVQLTNGTYRRFMHSPDRRVRSAAFEGMLGTFRKQEHTLAATLGTLVKKDIFFARARQYDSALEMALGGTHIPPSVYHTLVETVNAHLPVMHRYLALRSRVLALGEPLHMYDLYAPLVPDTDMEIEYEAACATVTAAFAPLGEEYVDAVQTALRSRWIDVVENKGKISGAYSGGSYGTPPYILLNYQARRDDMFTLAHEIGHSMHSYFSAQAQPYHYAYYGIFLAEIASTLNEALLRRHLLATTTDKALRASIINDYVEGFRTTMLRQTLFAEFELRAHAHAEAGNSLTVDAFRQIYRDLVRHYYGVGGVVVDELIEWEWSIIPHFYNSFYVFQYATGFAASIALAANIFAEGQPAVDRYLRLLGAGSSGYPIDLLKEAGVDMTTAAPIEAAMQEFERAVAELETLV